MTYSTKTLLVKRRAVLEDRLARAREVANTIAGHIEQIDITLRHLEAVKAAMPVHLGERNRLVRPILTMLQQSPAPMSTREITIRAMQERGEDVTDKRQVVIMIERVRVALNRQRERGLVRSAGVAGGAAWWEVVR